jgi:hypothetical protein
MVKVLTIRDPRTGALIAEEQIPPGEENDSALVRVYRKTLGSGAPELTVLTSTTWLDDREWDAKLGRMWECFRLALLGPRGKTAPEETHLVLAGVSEREPIPRMEFPSDKSEIEEIRAGRRHKALIHASPEEPPAVGDRVKFVQWASDPFGESIPVKNGDSICVDLTEVTNQGEKWGSHDLYAIAWDPAPVRKSNKAAAHRSR